MTPCRVSAGREGGATAPRPCWGSSSPRRYVSSSFLESHCMALADIFVPKLRSNGDGAPPFRKGRETFSVFRGLVFSCIMKASSNHFQTPNRGFSVFTQQCRGFFFSCFGIPKHRDLFPLISRRETCCMCPSTFFLQSKTPFPSSEYSW